MLEAVVVDGQPAVVTTPPPSSVVERLGADGASIGSVWMLYDVEYVTRKCSLTFSIIMLSNLLTCYES